MKRLSLAFLVALGAIPVHAQQANVVAACGSMAPFGALKAGGTAYPTIDVNGRLCLSGGTTTALENKVRELEARLEKLEARK